MNNETPHTSASAFNDLLSKSVSLLKPRPLRRGECQTLSGAPCRLCSAYRIGYEEERTIKNDVLQQFWNRLGLGEPLQPLIASPRGRNYRTVTKRKVFHVQDRLQLGLIDMDENSPGMNPMPVEECMIEPVAHAEIYKSVQQYLDRKEFRDAASELSYVIVKGNYDEFTVIFNLASFDLLVRQFINRLSKQVTGKVPGVKSVFVFVDEKQSQYYLQQRQKNQKLQMQKIFGHSEIAQRVGSKKFLFSPLSFSQTNLSIVEEFVATMTTALDLRPNDHLLDLYCGYGVFSLSMANNVRSATGVEISREAIHDAIDNAQRLKITNCRYIAGDINEESLERILSSHTAFTKVILDPPRNGTKEGVIEMIAAKNVRRAVHIFCNIEQMPSELARWKNCGYEIVKAVPFDMFPGTSEVEMIVALERKG